MDTIQILCPHCGALLTVRSVAGMERMAVTCPVCSQKSPFTECRAPRTNRVDETVVPDAMRHTAVYESGFLMEKDGTRHELSEGINVIGRKSPRSSADIQIETGDNRGMSREHLEIQVTRCGNGTFRHVLTLHKPKVNATSVDGVALRYPDSVNIAPGAVIDMAGITLRFGIEDEDATAF